MLYYLFIPLYEKFEIPCCGYFKFSRIKSCFCQPIRLHYFLAMPVKSRLVDHILANLIKVNQTPFVGELMNTNPRSNSERGLVQNRLWRPFPESPETLRVFLEWQFSLYLQNKGVSRHETLQLLKFLFPLQYMKRSALQNKQVGVLWMAFRARKDFGTFEKRAPGVCRHVGHMN